MTALSTGMTGKSTDLASLANSLADKIPAEERDEVLSAMDLEMAKVMPGSNPGLEEYIKKARGLIKELFTLTDTDGSGFLDKDEIAAMLADGRVEAFKTAATSALEEMDADEVTLSDYCCPLSQRPHPHPLASPSTLVQV